MPADPRPAVNVSPGLFRRLADLLELGDLRSSRESLELLSILGRLSPGDKVIRVQALAALLARLCAGMLERVGRQPSEPS